jgi:tetratricopeptide (TPR) repeat protein
MATALPLLFLLFLFPRCASLPGAASEQPALIETPEAVGTPVETAPQTAETVEGYLERAQAFADQRDYERAIAEYDRALALDPACSDAYIKRGDANMSLWNYDLAIADYSRVIELDGRHKDAYLKRGNAYQADNQAQPAWDDYITTIQIDPGFVDGYRACGFLLSAVGNHRDAVTIFTRALELDPHNIALLMGRILANMNLGDAEGVLADCRIIREQFPDQNLTAYIYEAQVYQYLGEFDRAVEVLKQGIDQIPAGAMNIFPLITRALQAKGYSESDALAELKRVVDELPATNPKEADFKDYLLAMISVGDPAIDFEQSIAEQRRRIITMDKRGVMPYFSLLTYYLGREDIDGAIDEMNLAVERSPEDSGPYAMRAFVTFLKIVSDLMEKPQEGRIVLFREQSAAVIADCDRALAFDGDLAGVYQIRGLAKRLGELPGAEADLSEAIRLKPDGKENWYARGWSYFDGGNFPAARKDFIQTLNIDNNFNEALYGLARSCAAMGDHRQAVNFYTRYLYNNADDIDALYYRSQSLRALGETKAAEDDLVKLRELNTEDREIRESLSLQIGFNVSF